MGSQKGNKTSGRSLSLKTGNKLHRQALYIQNKKNADRTRHEERHRRKKEEEKDPELRRARLERNQPVSLDMKRVWDDGDGETLGSAVDIAQVKRRRIEEEEAEAAKQAEGGEADEAEPDDELDSMLGSEDEDQEEDDDDDDEDKLMERIRRKAMARDTSVAPSTTSTNLDITPAALAAKFPNLFTEDPVPPPKILVTTSLNATIHSEAQDIGRLFPNSQYIPRSAHRYGHRYSVREICKFATNREFTAVVVVQEDLKKPSRLSIAHLPHGPTLTYTISRYTPGKRLPGHGNPTNHYPELLLNNFKTSLGLLAAKSFWTLFPPQPEIVGRQVVSLSNSRDHIFLRHHRYVVRDRRATERSVVGVDGKEIKGFEGIRVGLQELGPRFTMKLRRVDKGIGRAGSEGEDAQPWEWKAKMEKKRTRFNL